MTTAEQKTKRNAIRALGKSPDNTGAVQSIIDIASTDIALAKVAFSALQQINTPEAVLAHGRIVAAYNEREPLPIRHNRPLELCCLACVDSLGKVDTSHSEEICKVLQNLPRTEEITLKTFKLLTSIGKATPANPSADLISYLISRDSLSSRIYVAGIMALHGIGKRETDNNAIAYAKISNSQGSLPLLRHLVNHYETKADPYNPKAAKEILATCVSEIIGNLAVTFDGVAGTGKKRKSLCDMFMRAHRIGLLENPATVLEVLEGYRQLAIK